MTIDSELVRLAIALAHAIPDGWIEISLDEGSVIRAERGAGALSPCDLRASAVMRSCPLWSGASDRIAAVRMGGEDATDLGVGLYGRSGANGRAERWFATVLAPSSVAELIESCPLEFAAAVDASLRPDPELGVTVALLSSPAADEGSLDEAARWAASQCYVREFLQTVQVA